MRINVIYQKEYEGGVGGVCYSWGEILHFKPAQTFRENKKKKKKRVFLSTQF